MAKVAANTITDLQFPRGQAPRIDPSSHAGQIGAAMAASARPYAQMAENAAAMGRRRVANIHARTREIQDAMGNFARGLSAGIEGVDAALDRRADEQADAEMARYSMHLLQNRDADYGTPIRGDLAADVAHGDGAAPDGPYLAVSRRMAGWSETETYKALSDRARRKFEEKRRNFDQRTLSAAMNEHVGRQRKMREAEEEAVYASKAAIAADAAIDVTNPQHMDWHLLADDAIGKAVQISLRRQGMLGDDGDVLPGYEAVEEAERRRITDAQYVGIWQAVAEKYAASDDEGEREALLKSLVTQVGGEADAKEAAKLLDAKDPEAVADALKAAAKGMPYSTEAAEAGWKLVKNAKKQLDARLERERVQLYHDTENLEYEIFTGTVDGDPFDAAQKASEMRSRLPAKDRDALNERVATWKYARDVTDYEKRVFDAWKLTNPDEQKARLDAIAAEVGQMDNPKTAKAVMSMLAGAAAPRGRTEGRMSATTARLAISDKTGTDALDTLAKWVESGEITRETWGACFRDVKDATFRDLDKAEVVRALASAGFDLGAVVELDEGRPVTDAKGNLKLVNEGGAQKVMVGWDVQEGFFGSRRVYADETFTGVLAGDPVYVDVANETVLRLYEAAVKFKALEKMGGAPKGMSLGDFVKKECAGDLKALSDARLRSAIARQDALMDSDFRAMELHGRGASSLVTVRGNADKE